MPFFAQASASLNLWPFAILAICIVAIIVMITVLRLHAFIALVIAAIFAGLLAENLPGEIGSVPGDPAAGNSHWIQAVELTMDGLGSTAGKIAVVIGLASVIGMCLMESGAADKVVRRFIAMFGEKRAGFAIVLSSYFLSIPIFFDTFFMLLLPLARAMRIRMGKDYLLYVMAICCGATVTHSLIAPHPGPLAMAESLKIDLGLTILVGIAAGIIPTMCSWMVIKWINKRMDVPMREIPGVSLAELEAVVAKPESELPSLGWAITPVILPILLISLASAFAAISGMKTDHPGLYRFVEFIGNRNTALFIGTAFAMALLMRQKGLTFRKVAELTGPFFETAGVIILITSAGGAFGMMLRNAGVGGAIQAAVAGHEINLILLSWLVAAVIRIAQGSATVAMLTTASMMYPIMESGTLPYHPVYVFMAIGFGAMMLSWMNDSGFWVVGRLSGLTEKETLKSWTVVVSVNSLVGLLVCMLFSFLLPFAQGAPAIPSP
ncbi:MAG: SLC13 family permease [Verrucomicrobia bacterium]|nr:SLC13 family permease [Verrucomicrobiota bacterium]